MTLLTSCATLPTPPAALTKDCEITYLKGKATNAKVVEVAVAREYDVRLCNADKAALRAYYEGLCGRWSIRCTQRKP